MAESQKQKRKIWSKEDTLLFLECYNERKDEFEHARKKRNAYSNVLESMIYKGFEDTSVTPTALESKMRSLLNSYKMANDNNKQTGASPCVAPYFEQLDEIFGEKPCQSNNHTLNVGTTPVELEPDDFVYEYLLEDEPPPSTSSFCSTTFVPIDNALSPLPSTSSRPTPASSPDVATQNPKKTKKMTAREKYYAEKLDIKKKHLERRDRFYTKIEKFLDDNA